MGNEGSRPVPLQPRLKRNESRFCGLVNFGSTCYFNAIIVALFASPSFRKVVLSATETNDPLASSFQALYAEMCTTKAASISPKDLFTRLNKLKPDWTSYQQQDAHELLNFLLNHLEEKAGANRKPQISPPIASEMDFLDRESTIDPVHSPPTTKVLTTCAVSGNLVSLFEGFLRRRTSCLICEHASSNLERFVDLPLDVVAADEGATAASYAYLERAIEALSRPEHLPSSTKIFCEECQMPQAAVRSARLWQLPKICVFQLKRFRCDSDRGVLSKLSDLMTFMPEMSLTLPLRVDTFFKDDPLPAALACLGSSLVLTQGGVQRREESALKDVLRAVNVNESGNPESLSLVAVVCHVGPSLFAGHYVTVVRDGEQWNLIDDEYVTRLTSVQCSDFFRGTKTHLNGLLDTRHAYLLFYERK